MGLSDMIGVPITKDALCNVFDKEMKVVFANQSFLSYLMGFSICIVNVQNYLCPSVMVSIVTLC